MNGVPPSIEISGECNRRSVTHNLPGTTTTTMVIDISLIGSGLRSTELFPREEFRPGRKQLLNRVNMSPWSSFEQHKPD